jgi:DNA-binding IclR family transcriptional regulator
MPVKPSPSVLRSSRLLTELALRPTEEATLSDLARRVGINKASCQCLLMALVEEGLVARGTNRTYRLGPRLIHLGEAAKASLRLQEMVEPALISLTAEFAVTSMCGMKAGSEVVVVAVNELLDPSSGLTIPLGQRRLLRAPFGAIYVAWETESEIAAWIDRAEPPLSEQDQMEARRSIEVVRRRGCTVTVRRPDTPEIGYRVGTGSRDSQGTVESGNPNMEYPEEPDETPKWTVLGIGAPIFAPDGTMLCVIAVTGLPVQATHRDILHISQSVLSAAAAATSRIGM